MNHKFKLLVSGVLLLILLTVMVDFLESRFQNSSFYLSESFLFSSFWWLFPLFLYGQFSWSGTKKSSLFWVIIFPLTLHLLTFPGLVWLISLVFYKHTFWYWQTFRYALTEYLFILLLVYSLPLILYLTFIHKLKTVSVITGDEPHSFVTQLVVSEGYKRIPIQTKDILYFMANPPYVTIHHPTKKYLHNESLKSIACQLDPTQFLRIHKSHIVNLNQVQSYASRGNGDYDLILCDGTLLRLSRNYAKEFKQQFEPVHQVRI